MDDGSTDESGKLIDIAKGRDKRIVAVHQKNSGPANARNKEIDIVSGDYVVFLNSDHYLHKD